MIWFGNYSKNDWIKLSKNTMLELLDIRIEHVGDDFIKGSMPVDHRTVQPYGILHGGASVVLAESLGSIAGHMSVDSNKFQCVGLEVNANHIRPVREGRVYGTAKPIHLGKKTQVWEIRISSEQDKLICISRLTMAIIKKQH